jgi:hypothetical protein
LFGSAELLTLDGARGIAVNIAKLRRHRLERAISTLAWRGTTTPFVYLCYTSLIGDGHHQKYEHDTNFFVCLLIHRYRIDALRWSASHHIAVQEPGFCHA